MQLRPRAIATAWLLCECDGDDDDDDDDDDNDDDGEDHGAQRRPSLARSVRVAEGQRSIICRSLSQKPTTIFVALVGRRDFRAG